MGNSVTNSGTVLNVRWCDALSTVVCGGSTFTIYNRGSGFVIKQLGVNLNFFF